MNGSKIYSLSGDKRELPSRQMQPLTMGSPSPRPSPPERGGIVGGRSSYPTANTTSEAVLRCSLSSGERAGVRENVPLELSKTRALWLSVELIKSSCRAGGVPTML